MIDWFKQMQYVWNPSQNIHMKRSSSIMDLSWNWPRNPSTTKGQGAETKHRVKKSTRVPGTSNSWTGIGNSKVFEAMCLCLFQVHQHGPGKPEKGDHLLKEFKHRHWKRWSHPSIFARLLMVCKSFFPGISEAGEAMVSRSLEDPKAHHFRKIFTYMCLTFFSSHLWNLSTNMDHYLESSPNIVGFFRPKVSIVAGKFGNFILTRCLCQIDFLVNKKYT